MRGVPGWQLTRCIVTTLLRGAESIRMIYRARAGTFFCIFFVFLARVSSGVEKYVVGFQNHFAKNKTKNQNSKLGVPGDSFQHFLRGAFKVFLLFSVVLSSASQISKPDFWFAVLLLFPCVFWIRIFSRINNHNNNNVYIKK